VTLRLTTAAALKAASPVKIPILVLEINEHERIYTVAAVKRFIKIGDPGLEIGNDWVIGGFTEAEQQANLIQLAGGTTTSLSQQLDPDVAAVSSVSTFQVRLVDKDGEISRLITPGMVLTDILGRRARILLGFDDTAYPQDYVEQFAGNIIDVWSGAGFVDLVIAHPEEKKAQKIFIKLDAELEGDHDNSTTTIALAGDTDMSRVRRPVAGPDGVFDSSIEFYVKIHDEVIRYTGVSGTSLTGCTRAQLGTAAAAHSDGSTVNSLVKLEGNAIDLALKLMLSGVNGPSIEGVPVAWFLFSFSRIPGSVDLMVLFFENIDLQRELGVNPGDWVTTEDADNAENNFTERQILSMHYVPDINPGTFVVVDSTDGAAVLEIPSSAKASFRSQFDTLGHGLGMTIQEVDVARHIEVRNRYVGSLDLRFWLRDTIEGQAFIANECYKPVAAYSLPRSGRVSIGITVPPTPLDTIQVLDKHSIMEPSSIVLKRSSTRNFHNTLIYKFDEDVLTGEFQTTYPREDEESFARIPSLGVKDLTIESRGLRSDLGGKSHVNAAATKRFNRYRFGAEFIEGLKVPFGKGFILEVGDIVLVDFDGLHVTDTVLGTRFKQPRFMEIVNKVQPFAPGPVTLSLVDTNYDVGTRYGLRSPASKLKGMRESNELVIKNSFSNYLGGRNELTKWTHLVGKDVMLRVRTPDGSSSDMGILTLAQGNILTLDRALNFVAPEDSIVELAPYSYQPEFATSLYAFMIDGATFPDGKPQYRMF
jgi:hypothetical protein